MIGVYPQLARAGKVEFVWGGTLRFHARRPSRTPGKFDGMYFAAGLRAGHGVAAAHPGSGREARRPHLAAIPNDIPFAGHHVFPAAPHLACASGHTWAAPLSAGAWYKISRLAKRRGAYFPYFLTLLPSLFSLSSIPPIHHRPSSSAANGVPPNRPRQMGRCPPSADGAHGERARPTTLQQTCAAPRNPEWPSQIWVGSFAICPRRQPPSKIVTLRCGSPNVDGQEVAPSFSAPSQRA